MKETYKIMMSKLQIINNNFSNCINEMDKLKNKMEEALMINGNCFYKSDVEAHKQNVLSYHNFINYDIIPEIKNNL